MARFDVVRILLAALAITLAFTIYVAFMVARPLNRLARATQNVQNGRVDIPDLSARGDEIGALSVVLRRATRALYDRLDAIERFAADIAHELKNPLTSLRSAIETLPRLNDASKRDKLMAIMADDTERLDRLITDISHLSRLDSELSRTQLEPIDLHMVLTHVLRAYVPPEAMIDGSMPVTTVIGEKGIRLECRIEASIPLVAGYPGRFEQVFGNLIGNAISFSPVHGRVLIDVRARANIVSVQIEDEGIGIPEGRQEAIFTRFYSERPVDEQFGTHSGLGLAIARQIVESVHGRIWAENRVASDGRVLGARFIVELPISV